MLWLGSFCFVYWFEVGLEGVVEVGLEVGFGSRVWDSGLGVGFGSRVWSRVWESSLEVGFVSWVWKLGLDVEFGKLG